MLKLNFFLAVFLVCISLNVFSQDIESNQFTFSSLGYGDFSADKIDSNRCFSFDFVSDYDARLVPVISLHLGFFGQEKNFSEINVFLNGTDLGMFSSKNLLSVNSGENYFDGWLRIMNFKEKLIPSEVNELSICIIPSQGAPQISLFSDSFIGNFFSPDLSRENSFEMNLLGDAVAGKDLLVKVTLRNYGSQEQEVTVTYRKDELEHRTPWVKFVSGQSSLRGVVPSCTEFDELDCVVPGEKDFSYLVRISKANPLMILPAILVYTNFFGEKMEKIESNRLYLEVKAPPVELTPFIELEKEEFSANEAIPFKVIIQNEGVIDSPQIQLNVFSDELNLNESNQIQLLNSREQHEFLYSVQPSATGTYSIHCTALIPDYELEFSCTDAAIKVIEPELPIELIGGGALLLISVIVFVYFYWIRKSRN
ncbi:MAG: CARDB domain-containing protein [Candidatus Diapherotrites archaeon]